MIYPEFLKKGGWIGVTAPSAGSVEELDHVRMDQAGRRLAKMGYPVLETPNARTGENGRSGSAAERAAQLNSLLTDNRIKWIVSVTGGDFLCEMLSVFDFEAVKEHPKWIQGYSDNTGLLFPITTLCGIATIYGNNFKDFGMEPWHRAVSDNLSLLCGTDVVQRSFDRYENGFYERKTGLEGYVLTEPVVWKNGRGEKRLELRGRLLGGCLDVLLMLCGTRFDGVTRFVERYREDGILWYLESFDLNDGELLRGLWQLKEAGWFSSAKGFVFGRPCFFENQAQSGGYEEAVLPVLEDLQVPVVFDADIGHKAPRFTIINGAMGRFVSGEGKGSLTMQLKP